MSTTKQHIGKQMIGPENNPYMVRYILFRWAHLPRVYVHKFLRSDDERAPHNHPWWFMSLVLSGSYLEYTDDPASPILRKRFSFAYRPLSVFHRVALPNGRRRDGTYGPLPCWTIVVTGPDVRSWGFRCQSRKHDTWCLYPCLYCTCSYQSRQPVTYVVPWREFNGCGE